MKSVNFLLVFLIALVAAQTLPADTNTSTSTSASNTSASQTSATSASDTATSTSASQTSSSTSTTTTSSSSTATSATSAPNAPTTTPPPTTPATSLPPVISLTTSDGVVVITTIVGQSSTSSSAAPTGSGVSDTSGGNSSEGLSTGSIVGLSVAGGIAVIGIIAFFVWKFTRKRFSDFDDNEAIKWPDLNTHGAGTAGDSHPLPVKNTGRSGFDTGSEGSLSRVPSTSNYSTPDFHSGTTNDPYAVPPLPHLNPNQPYRDDPGAAYYDPYRGPVPGTLEHNPQGWGGEAIPMNTMNPSGRMSPGPHAAYGGAEPAYEYDLGSQSPAPGAVGYGGRSSPGPQAAYGGGRASPGPRVAYGGAASPAPGYDAYGGR